MFLVISGINYVYVNGTPVENIAGDRGIIFGTILIPYQSTDLQTEALQCAKHCRLCCERPEHSCADKIDGEQCQKFRLNQSCWKTTFPSKKQRRKHTKMVNQCAGTCGICSRRKEWNEETMCRFIELVVFYKELTRDQQWACSDMAPLCALDARVRRICPKTWEQQLKKLNPGSSTDSEADYESPCQEQKSLHEFAFKQPEEGFPYNFNCFHLFRHFADEDCIDTRADCRKDIFFCEMPVILLLWSFLNAFPHAELLPKTGQ